MDLGPEDASGTNWANEDDSAIAGLVSSGDASGAGDNQPQRDSGVKTEAEKAEAAPPKCLADLRDQIERLVRESSGGIAEALIKEAKGGSLAHTKYLFEIVGVHPAKDEATFRPENTLAYRLLKRLGLPTEPISREEDGVSVGESY